jgi:predicted chitinase
MLTSEQLHAIMPQLAAAKGATLFPFLTAAIAEFAIDAPARTAAFLAQLAHESGQFRFMEEIWGPTPAQRRYEPVSTLASTLGNTEAGDGFRFKGRGPIQITGRANYKRFGDLLGLDLVGEPQHAAQPEVAFRVAALFWSKKGLNELADQVTPEAFKEITRRINGGFNGLPDRQKFYEAAKRVLDVVPPPVTRGGPPPADTGDPGFERGAEAIRSETTTRPRRKTAAKKTAARPSAKKSAAAKRTRVKPGVARKRAATKGTRKGAAKKRAARKGTAKKPAARTRTPKRGAANRRTRKSRA